MSYQITHYNGAAFSPAITVADGTLDTSLDLKIIGKSYAGYGLAQNENFIYLLENFASNSAPSKPIAGQIWFDSLHNKVKFYDINRSWRSLSGTTATTYANKPTNLVTGDLWYDTDHNQVNVFNGVDFTLVGGSVATGQNTQMVSVNVTDTNGITHAIIKAIVNGRVIYVVSPETDPAGFQLDTTINSIPGFVIIMPGITLVGTPGYGQSQAGITAGHERFYGTASNSDLLGGLPAANFIQSTNATFSSQVKFYDQGFTIGTTPKLTFAIDGTGTPVLQSTYLGNSIKFQTTDGTGATQTPMVLTGKDILPNAAIGGNIGSQALQWNSVYANYVYATSKNADNLLVTDTGAGYAQASIVNNTSSPSIVARDATGTINVTAMNGTASQAVALQLAGSATFLTATTTPTVNSIVARDVSGGIAVIAASVQSITKSGTANVGNIGQSDNKFGTVYASTFSGAVSGNVTGNVTGILTGNVASAATANQIASGSALVDATTGKMRANSISLGNGSAASPSLNFLSDSNSSSGFYWSTNGEINISNAGVYSGKFQANGNLTMVGNVTAVLFQGTATQARYADLAEKYLADKTYEPGTVVSIGGEKEVTASQIGDRALGVVSTNPAYMMNSELEGGTYIALKGRVPVRVYGRVSKGQPLIAYHEGAAQASMAGWTPEVFAQALETSADEGVKLIECVIL
jgi:hypothetical protein